LNTSAAAVDRTRQSGTPQLPRSWIITPLILLLMLLVMEGTNIDRDVSLWFFNASTRSFPWRHEFLLDTVFHHWAKYAVVLTTCIAAVLLALTWMVRRLRPHRALLLFIVLAMTLAPATVTALKLVTDRPCPWDLVDFGGSTPYTRLFQPRNVTHAQGQCFPAGHASTGFALMAFYFAAYRERRHALARAALSIGVLAGLLLGISRIAQGAHFVSHVLWAGLICWLVMLALHLALPAGEHPDSARHVM
jgi:membrane-associated PAP2 superfamily phosphatase